MSLVNGNQFKIHDPEHWHALQRAKPAVHAQEFARICVEHTHVFNAAAIGKVFTETTLCTRIKGEILGVSGAGMIRIPPA